MLRPTASRLVAGSLLALLLSGCALPPKDPVARAAWEEANDPLEPLNRVVFGFNQGVDILLLKPAAEVYHGITPDPVEKGVRNFLRNLRSPIILVNDLLQGDIKAASVTSSRMMVNTLFGVGGIIDVGEETGDLPFHDADFGQTLAVWGVGEGPYLVLPLLGPSSVRDATGSVVDSLGDPVSIYLRAEDADALILGRTGMTALDARVRVLGDLEELQETSLDYYAAIRSLYRQTRAREIGLEPELPVFE